MTSRVNPSILLGGMDEQLHEDPSRFQAMVVVADYLIEQAKELGFTHEIANGFGLTYLDIMKLPCTTD